MKLSGIQCVFVIDNCKDVFVVDKENRIRANIAYVTNDLGTIGAYYGYSGGAAYDDGYFYIPTNGPAIVSGDKTEFPEDVVILFEPLDIYKNQFMNHDEYEGGISVKGAALRNKGNVTSSKSSWEHRSSKVNQKILRIISAKWGLSYHWN